MNVVVKNEGRKALMPEGQKKWSDFPIGAAFPPNGAWKGQPQLVARGGPNFEMSAKDRKAFQAFFEKQGERHEVKDAVRQVLKEIEQNRGKWPWLNAKAKTQEYGHIPGEPTV